MKAKKMFLVLVFVLTSLLLVSAASAANYTCTISQVGVTSAGNYLVYLTDTAATPAWTGGRYFTLKATVGKETLAVALTAYANAKRVKVSLTSVDSLTIIGAFYVMD